MPNRFTGAIKITYNIWFYTHMYIHETHESNLASAQRNILCHFALQTIEYIILDKLHTIKHYIQI